MSNIVHNPNRFKLHGEWENIVDDLDSDIWNSSFAGRDGGVSAGVEVKHDGHHLGVMYPDGRWRTTSGDPFVDPSDEPYILERAGEKYAILYKSVGDLNYPNLLVLKQVEEPDQEYNYCPNCGQELQ